jgi:hypothetical protein
MKIISLARRSALTLLAVAAVAQSASLPDFQGTWKIDRKRSQNVTEAIDATVEPLNFVVRSIARSRLQKTNHPGATLVIAVADGNTSIHYDDKKAVTSPSDGKSASWSREDGEAAEITTKLTGSALIQTFKGAEGQKVNRLLLSPDNKDLVLETVVSSPKLPKPLQYQTVYHREP